MKKLCALALITMLAFSVALTGVAFARTDSDKPVTIMMAVATGMSEYYQLADNYMAIHPNITIEIEEYPTSELRSLIKAKLAGGDCWDIFASFPYEFIRLAAAGYLADLSDIGAEILPRYKDAEAITVSRTTEKGELVALPAQCQYLLLYYNKTLFAELGLSVPNNWEEFLAVIEAGKAAGITPIATGFKDNWCGTHTLNCFASSAVQVKEPEWGPMRHANEVKFEGDPGWTEAVEKLRTLIGMGAYSATAVSTSDEQAMLSFVNGDTLMYFGGTWGLNSLINAMPAGFDMGGMRYPTNDPGQPVVLNYSLAGDFSVWVDSPVAEEAKAWLAYTLSADQNLIFNSTKGPSPFKDVAVPLHASLIELEEQTKDGVMFEWASIVQRWPDGSPHPEPLVPLIQGLFYPSLALPTDEFLAELDAGWDEAALSTLGN